MSLREMSTADADSVVQVHLASFPGFFLSSLGPAFLRLFYKAVAEDATGIAVVAERDDAIVGFVCGSSRPGGFYRRLFRRQWWKFGAAAAGTLVRHPSRIAHLLGALRHRFDTADHGGSRWAELMSLAVCPGAQALGIGRRLALRFLSLAREAGAERVTLTTDRVGNERVNRFYIRTGFTLTKSFVTHTGRDMNEYEMETTVLPGHRSPAASEPAVNGGICPEREKSSSSRFPEDPPFLPFALPEIGEEEIAEVVDSLRSGWLTTGPKAKRFEEEFGHYIGAGVEALAVNSATAGLHLAAEACGIGPGDQVITTPYTFTATAEIIRYLGADPVFVDVLEDSLNIDPRLIESAVTSRTRAIIPVHFGGLACDMNSIMAIAARHQLKVIEDAAHALPATSAGRLIGTLESDATVYSFYATKTLATGEGGMIVTRNRELARRCRVMRLHGIDRDAFDRYTAKTPSWFYSVVAPGFKYNMTDLAAAIGIHQLRKVNQFQRRREEMAQRYDRAFERLCVRLPARAPAGDLHARHLYTIRLGADSPVSRDEFIEAMAKAGVGTSVHFIPLHLHAYWREAYALKAEQFPVATRAYRSIVSLPLYTRMTEADQDRVIHAVWSILDRPHRDMVSLVAAGEPDHGAGREQ